jgi:hypothetical protein
MVTVRGKQQRRNLGPKIEARYVFFVCFLFFCLKIVGWPWRDFEALLSPLVLSCARLVLGGRSPLGRAAALLARCLGRGIGAPQSPQTAPTPAQDLAPGFSRENASWFVSRDAARAAPYTTAQQGWTG